MNLKDEPNILSQVNSAPAVGVETGDIARVSGTWFAGGSLSIFLYVYPLTLPKGSPASPPTHKPFC